MAARRTLISAVLFFLSFNMVLATDSWSALVVRIEAVTDSRDWRFWCLRHSRSILASVSSCMLLVISSAGMPRLAAWSSLPSFVQKGAKEVNGAGLVGRARESVGVKASRRAVKLKGEVAV